jgi:hypothetical protein
MFEHFSQTSNANCFVLCAGFRVPYKSRTSGIPDAEGAVPDSLGKTKFAARAERHVRGAGVCVILNGVVLDSA